MLAHIISVFSRRENAQPSGDVLGGLHSPNAKGKLFIISHNTLTPTTKRSLGDLFQYRR